MNKSFDEQAERLAVVFKALSEPVRLRILERLNRAEPEEPLGVCELADSLNLPQPNVSHHLAILKTAGLVWCSKEACKCYYRTNSAALEAAFALLREKL